MQCTPREAIKGTPITFEMIRKATIEEPLLSQVEKYHLSKWSQNGTGYAKFPDSCTTAFVQDVLSLVWSTAKEQGKFFGSCVA
ncbi:hypothetical protein T265_05609 [Opisthorchis viverrini]|nr:hypothetical protein T265_05609 [Opisthorchis viverrini]KER27283.1 hypothetical protein T265_05609 [Opisthorchis viverrini]